MALLPLCMVMARPLWAVGPQDVGTNNACVAAAVTNVANEIERVTPQNQSLIALPASERPSFFRRIGQGLQRRLNFSNQVGLSDRAAMGGLLESGMIRQGSLEFVTDNATDPRMRQAEEAHQYNVDSRNYVRILPNLDRGPNYAYIRLGNHLYSVELNLTHGRLAAYIADLNQSRGGGYRTAPLIQPQPHVVATQASFKNIIFQLLREKRKLTEQDLQRLDPRSFQFIEIPEGTFTMGSQPHEPGRYTNERPHRVTIVNPSHAAIQRSKFTQSQIYAITGHNPSTHRLKEHSDNDYLRMDGTDINLNHPATNMNWAEGRALARHLSELDPDFDYRYTYEIETEATIRAGTDTAYFFGNDPTQLRNHAWESRNSGDRTHAVGTTAQNTHPLGMLDAHGNSWDWQEDAYDIDYGLTEEQLQNGITFDPATPPPPQLENPEVRVIRGGSWNLNAQNLRSANRSRDAPDDRYSDVGFRLVRIPKKRSP